MTGDPEENAGISSESLAMAVTTAGNDDKRVEEKKSKEVTKKKKKKKKKKEGLLLRIWNGIFSSRKDDFERRLERLSKEEAAVLTRMRRRAQNWGRMKRHLILFSVLLEIFVVCYALMMARTAENWKIRALRVLPMFVLPALLSGIYSSLASFIKISERKDQKTLEKLRIERQLKIDELKEKTNYYITQQLIQRYDTDPAAKAAAASVLASKLGAESGLKVFLGDESKPSTPTGKSNDFELLQSSGLRNRKQRPSSTVSPSGTMQHSGELSPYTGSEFADYNQQLLVDNYQPPGPTVYNNGWLSRIAALLVGEDPTQCFALICGNCHMHNGLASKEDFPYVTYICPHCHVVNGPKIRQEHVSATISPKLSSTVSMDLGNPSSIPGGSPRDNIAENNNPDAASLVTNEDVEPEVTGGNEN